MDWFLTSGYREFQIFYFKTSGRGILVNETRRLLSSKLCNSNYLVMTLAMAELIGRVNDGSNGIYRLRNNKYNYKY